ncbi:MAG: hypothetical protein IBJ18_01555 [Phycisphaerales bacterium]|nr:hypothetical protein [Phycisphaerales bacterium]
MGAIDDTYIPIREVAKRLRLPARWLLDEARARRIPCLRASRRWLAKPADVEAALDARAKENATNAPSAGGAA